MLVNQMNSNETDPGTLPHTGWQVLGELELTVGSNVEEQIRAWLMDLLVSLRLHESFLSKLFASAQEYSLRALQSTMESGQGHVHLAILVQQEYAPLGNTWGFFRIEKIDSPEEDVSHPDHVVEFYLYMEGQ